ncbi:hypothetical protein GJ699_06150 [Duganella sp. FT80W]|uniref:Uncharacterized protein n=1 Tax=Duganella guangzhouensis TaxID=2666084 RepID=A0A6I2KVS2_9BURK|nr:hypothetical protein [Duganella guangzhouensis]MRW89560.1 hypothetical protein [Duganella guangzhouensis]
MKKQTLVIYHYFEKDRSYIENFFHFLAFGYSAELDYLIVIAGGHSVNLPQLENVRYLYTENKNNDFGGYCHAIKTAIDLHAYEYYVFVNSSVRGPYTAAYSKTCWTNYFLDQLKADPEVGLIGSTINVLSPDSPDSIGYGQKYGGQAPYSHVQTMCYAMPQAVLIYLHDSGFYDVEAELSKTAVIRDYEIRLSQAVLGQGWNIRSLLPEYNHIDYRLKHTNINPVSAHGDANCNFGYFGRTPHPFEVIFMKVNRNMLSMDYLDRLSYSIYTNSRPHEALFQNSSFCLYMQSLEDAAASRLKVDFHEQKKWIHKLIPKPLRPMSRRLFPSLA